VSEVLEALLGSREEDRIERNDCVVYWVWILGYPDLTALTETELVRK
jgi:hypothetical protein